MIDGSPNDIRIEYGYIMLYIYICMYAVYHMDDYKYGYGIHVQLILSGRIYIHCHIYIHMLMGVYGNMRVYIYIS